MIAATEDKALRKEDRLRELALMVLVTADACRISGVAALHRVGRAFVSDTPSDEPPPTPYFRPERLDALLPGVEEWRAGLAKLESYAQAYDANDAKVDQLLRDASPRWRLDRMSSVDRCLLRLGCLELVAMTDLRPRQTINGAVELAKRYGSDTSRAFVNGILDQVRKNLGMPFR
mgnify:CR=1 FL=1